MAGYDVGSRVAQTVARSFPDRVHALVASPPLPGAGKRVLEPDAEREFRYQPFHQLSLAEVTSARDERIAVPTTVLWPEFDPSFPLAWGDRLGEFFADATLTSLPAWATSSRSKRPVTSRPRSAPPSPL